MTQVTPEARLGPPGTIMEGAHRSENSAETYDFNESKTDRDQDVFAEAGDTRTKEKMSPLEKAAAWEREREAESSSKAAVDGADSKSDWTKNWSDRFALSDHINEASIDANYEEHMAGCNWLDRSFVFGGLSSMRRVIAVLFVLGPLIYLHPWMFSYAYLEKYFTAVMIWRNTCSCEGNSAAMSWTTVRMGIGKDVERIPFWAEMLVMSLVTLGVCTYNYLFIDQEGDPTANRYGNVAMFNPLQYVAVACWYTWCVKGRYQLKLVSTRRVIVNFLATSAQKGLGQGSIMGMLALYRPALNAYSNELGDGPLARFVFDMCALGAVTSIFIPVAYKVGSYIMFGPLNPSGRQDRVRRDGAWGTENRCTYTGNMAYIMNFADRSSLALFFSRSTILFASPIAIIVNLTKDTIFLIAHFNIKFAVEFMCLHLQRSPWRGPKFLRNITDGELKRSYLGNDYIQPEHIEELLESEKFVYINDQTEDQLEIYAKLPEKGKQLKKFMQYAVEFVPVNFRCAQAENVVYPWQAHMVISEAEKLSFSESQLRAWEWLSGEDFLRSWSEKHLLDLKHDLNRAFLPMGVCVAQAYGLPGLADTDVIGMQHYQTNAQKASDLLVADLSGAVEAWIVRPEGSEHAKWRTYHEEDDYMGNPQSYAGHMMNWYAGVGDEFSHNTKERVEKDVQLLGYGSSVEEWKEALRAKTGDTHAYAEFRRLRRREHTAFKPANWWNGPSPFADDYEVSESCRLGTVSPYHQAALSPLVLRWQTRNMMLCMFRWCCKFLGVIMVVILVSVTKPQLEWFVERDNLHPQLMVNEFLRWASIDVFRWALVLLHIVVDIVEQFFTERNRWSTVVGGRKRALPLMNEMANHELGMHEFRWWKMIRWYLATTTSAVTGIMVIVVVKYGGESPMNTPNRVVPRLRKDLY